jgi:hypothetical protein
MEKATEEHWREPSVQILILKYLATSPREMFGFITFGAICRSSLALGHSESYRGLYVLNGDRSPTSQRWPNGSVKPPCR